jgi:periplasmic protein TonB
VVRSAGPTREHKMLDRLALSKLSECQFRPGTDENGKPVGATTEVEYVWKLD